MKVKTGVKLSDLQMPMRLVLIEADALWKSEGFDLTITSAGDGVHSAGSLHPYGYAVDFRTWQKRKPGIQWPMPFKREMAKRLLQRLGPKYQVIPESTHIHVEYQHALSRQSRSEVG